MQYELQWAGFKTYNVPRKMFIKCQVSFMQFLLLLNWRICCNQSSTAQYPKNSSFLFTIFTATFPTDSLQKRKISLHHTTAYIRTHSNEQMNEQMNECTHAHTRAHTHTQSILSLMFPIIIFIPLRIKEKITTIYFLQFTDV